MACGSIQNDCNKKTANKHFDYSKSGILEPLTTATNRDEAIRNIIKERVIRQIMNNPNNKIHR